MQPMLLICYRPILWIYAQCTPVNLFVTCVSYKYDTLLSYIFFFYQCRQKEVCINDSPLWMKLRTFKFLCNKECTLQNSITPLFYFIIICFSLFLVVCICTIWSHGPTDMDHFDVGMNAVNFNVVQIVTKV